MRRQNKARCVQGEAKYHQTFSLQLLKQEQTIPFKTGLFQTAGRVKTCWLLICYKSQHQSDLTHPQHSFSLILLIIPAFIYVSSACLCVDVSSTNKHIVLATSAKTTGSLMKHKLGI